MSNPFFDRSVRKTGEVGRLAEKKAAKRLGGDLRPSSGAMDGAKGDYTIGRFLVENKSTQTANLSLKQDWLLKIYYEALELGKIPALSLAFTNVNGESSRNSRWVCVPEHVFKELVSELPKED